MNAPRSHFTPSPILQVLYLCSCVSAACACIMTIDGATATMPNIYILWPRAGAHFVVRMQRIHVYFHLGPSHSGKHLQANIRTLADLETSELNR